MEEQTNTDSSLKLLTLNVEKNFHIDKVIPLLEAEQPDVVCLQEVFESDLPAIKQALGLHAVYGTFAPMIYLPNRENPDIIETQGVAIISKHQLSDIRQDYYVTSGRAAGELVMFDYTESTVQRQLLSAVVRKEDERFRIATTHFTWTPNGLPDSRQKRDINELLTLTAQLGEHILCGDFNAPRGNEIYAQLAENYTDNIPSEVTTTLDKDLHKAKGLEYVVDYVFTTSGFAVSDVRIIDGVSDHCAIVSEVHIPASSPVAEFDEDRELALA